MKKLTAYLLSISLAFLRCEGSSQTKESPIQINSIELSQEEKELCESIEFDLELASIIKTQTSENIEFIPKIDSTTGEAIANSFGNGICVVPTNQNDYSFVLKNKEKFKSKGYLLFLFNNDETMKNYIAIVKGQDELEIVEWRKSNGINYGHDNQDLLVKFRAWKQKNDFWVLGAGLDFVFIQFKEKKENVESFAQELYQFCPDIIDQGVGDMPALVKAIIDYNNVYFWWD